MSRTKSVADADDSLALAIVCSSHAPLLLLDGDFAVIAASASFRHAFGPMPDMVTGHALADLGTGEWNVPQLASLLGTVAAGHAEIGAYEMDLVRAGHANRRLVLNARRLDHGRAEQVRLLLSVADVTDTRLADALREDMRRENTVLLQELQHRVANSLQIIASILMQSARRVQSDETRTHLYDAHERVLSVAAVQKQLAVTRLGDVALRDYFAELCRSIGASMIRDRTALLLETHVDGSVTSASVSVSLGLILTELVINALKHAFPGQRGGRIVVDYRSQGSEWTLSVDDDGVGMPADARSAPPGLGTSIVQALAKQLGASVEIGDARPGTRVSIVHA